MGDGKTKTDRNFILSSRFSFHIPFSFCFLISRLFISGGSSVFFS